MTSSQSSQGAVSPTARGGRRRGTGGRDGGPQVPRAEPRDYYGQPVIAEPVWSWEIPAYFFTGGLAGAAAPLAAAAGLAGNDVLARRAWLVALGGAAVSPALLISDLGRPARFLRMLRVFRPTSPMSVGTWVLSAFGTATGLATGSRLLGIPPASIGVPAQVVAAITGPVVSTYTAVLIANTAVPAWHDARRILPLVFAGSSLASAGGLVTAVTPAKAATAARALALTGALTELVSAPLMEHRLDKRVKAAYEGTSVKLLSRGGGACMLAGGAAIAARARTSRVAAVAGGLALCAGAALERWAIFKAGTASAGDPQATVGPQRDRVDGRVPIKRHAHPAPDAPPAPRPGVDVPGPSASGPGMPPAQDDPIAPRRGV